MTQKKITPRAGMIVPLPDGNGNLPAEGKIVALNSYWYQRQFDGDVTIEDVPAVAEVPAVAKALPVAPTVIDAAAISDAVSEMAAALTNPGNKPK